MALMIAATCAANPQLSDFAYGLHRLAV